MRLKILPRYILSLYLANLALGLIIFTFVLLLDRLFELVDLLITKGAGFALTFHLLFLLLPASLTLTLPISNLLASLLTFGQLSETNEMTAARASGIKTWSLVRGPVMVALLSTLFLIPFNTRWGPQANTQFRQIYVQLLQRNPLIHIEEKTFSDMGEYHMYVERKSWRNPHLRGITIYKTPPQGAPLRIFAERGEANVDPLQGIRLTLMDGHIQEINPTDPHRWFYITFKIYELSIPFDNPQKNQSRSIEEMDNSELMKEAAGLREKGLPYPIYTCEENLRWALAVTPLLFISLGIPLALRVKRGGRSIGFGLSLLILLIYYILLMSGVGIAQRGVLPIPPLVWFANATVALVGLILGRRLSQQ